ncbi:hypothetical protein Hanom_Chr06g00557351 [Helianthus anomalus]
MSTAGPSLRLPLLSSSLITTTASLSISLRSIIAPPPEGGSGYRRLYISREERETGGCV